MFLSATISEMMSASLNERPVLVVLVEVEEEFDEESEDELPETEEFPDVVVFPDGLSVAFDAEEEFEGVVGSSEDEEFEAELLELELKLKELRLSTVLQEMEVVMSLVELQAVNFVPLLTKARIVFPSTIRYCLRIFLDARPITNFLPVSQPSTLIILARSIYSQESPFRFALPLF